MRRLLPVLFLVLLGFAVADPLARVEPRDATPAVGWVLAGDVGKGSGWILDTDKRLLVTCWHVVGDNETVEVVFPTAGEVKRAWYLEHMPKLRQSGQAVRGKVLHREIGVDLALVELTALPVGTPALSLAGSGVIPGERVWAVGNRYDTELLWLRASGWVRKVHPLKEGYFTGGKQVARGAWVIDARVPIHEGDSGGPLLNANGRVVGVAAAVAWEHQGTGYFIDLRELRAFLERADKRPTAGGEGSAPRAESSARDLYRQVLPSCVLVNPRDTKRRGSGWIVDRERRLVLTGAELVGDRRSASVRFPGSTEPATGIVLVREERRNLALLELDRLPKEARAGAFAEAEPAPGDPLHAITQAARPELDWLYLGTLLRQTGRVKLGREEDENPRVLLLQAQASEGEEGAAIMDNRGQVVGQHVGKGPPQQQIAYAVTAGEIRDFLRQHQGRWDPRSESEGVARAKIFREARARTLALRELNRVLESTPNSATACAERAGLLLLHNEREAALADAEHAVKLAPENPEGWYRRAEVRAAQDLLREALEDSERALRLNRQSAEAHRVHALVLRRLGRFNEALVHADEAVWLDRRNAAGFRDRGWIHLERDDARKALEDLDQALRLDEEDGLAYRLRGEARWIRGEVRGAREDFEAARHQRPEDARVWLGLGRISGEAHDFSQALARDPGLAAAYLERGLLRLSGPTPWLGLEDLGMAVRLQPSLRETALDRVRRRLATIERRDPVTAGRIALGTQVKLGRVPDGRFWWDLPNRPERWTELLTPR